MVDGTPLANTDRSIVTGARRGSSSAACLAQFCDGMCSRGGHGLLCVRVMGTGHNHWGRVGGKGCVCLCSRSRATCRAQQHAAPCGQQLVDCVSHTGASPPWTRRRRRCRSRAWRCPQTRSPCCAATPGGPASTSRPRATTRAWGRRSGGRLRERAAQRGHCGRRGQSAREMKRVWTAGRNVSRAAARRPTRRRHGSARNRWATACSCALRHATGLRHTLRAGSSSRYQRTAERSRGRAHRAAKRARPRASGTTPAVQQCTSWSQRMLSGRCQEVRCGAPRGAASGGRGTRTAGSWSVASKLTRDRPTDLTASLELFV